MSRTIALRINAYLEDESGATAIEYALIASFVFLGLVPLIQMMGGKVGDMYETILGYL